MKILYFDIETLPADEKSYASLKYLYKRKTDKKSKKKRSPDEENEDQEYKGFDDFVTNTSFDGAFGRTLCIAYAVNDEAPRVLCNPDNEKKTLEDFWFIARQCDLFVGHNVMDFDFRFLYQRSIVLGVNPQKDLNFARYRSSPIYDTMKEWSKWSNNYVGLEHVALALGIPTPKEGIDGSEVFNFYKAGKTKDICDYCIRDVETTRAVYKRMTFAN
jgi:3'-5' exonuclease